MIFFKKMRWYIKLCFWLIVVRLKYGSKSFFKPLKVTLKITERCNFKCKICGIWHSDNNKYLDLKKIDKIFSKYGKDVYFLSITGGEPFMDNKYLIKAIDVIIARCPNLYYLSFNTNGFFYLNIKSTLENLLSRYNFLKLYVGINYFPDKEWGKKRTGIKDSYKMMCRTIKIFDEIKLKYGAKLSYYKQFIVNEESDIRKIKNIKGDVWLNFTSKNIYYNNSKYFIKKLKNNTKLTIINRLLKDNKKLSFFNKKYLNKFKKFLVNKRRALKCYAGKNRVFIDSRGGEFICIRGVKKREDMNHDKCSECWTSCEALFDIIEEL